MSVTILKAKNVSKIYGKHKVLDKVSIEAKLRGNWFVLNIKLPTKGNIA